MIIAPNGTVDSIIKQLAKQLDEYPPAGSVNDHLARAIVVGVLEMERILGREVFL